MNEIDDISGKLLKHSQNRAKKIEKTIKEIKTQYKATEEKIQASGIPFVGVDVTKLIITVSEKHGVKERTVRRIAGWENLRTGNNKMDIRISKDEE